MKSTNTLIAVFLCTAVIASGATINPTSQARSVMYSADTGSGVTNLTVKAVGNGLFDNSIVFLAGAGYDHVRMNASQQSLIGDTSITATGSVESALGLQFYSMLKAASDFKVTFKLLQPVNFNLVASLFWDEIYAQGQSSPTITLSKGSTVLFSADVLGDATQYDFATNGVLQAGTYVLEAHALSAADWAGGDYKDYALAFDVTPIGSPPLATKTVYQLAGTLNGRVENNGVAQALPLSAAALVNLAIGQPSTNVVKNFVLALVVDCISGALPKVVLWDKTQKNVAVELGTFGVESDLGQVNPFWAIANLPFGNTGRIIDTLAGVGSQLTMATKTLMGATCITNVVMSPVVGQLNLVNDAGATNLVVITGGNLRTGTKLGGLP